VGNNALIAPGTAASALTLILTTGQVFTSQALDANHALGYIAAGGGNMEIRFTLKGDTNLDGAVGVGDLGSLATAYGITGGQTWANGDSNHDSNVDVSDLGALATNYGAQLGTGPSFGGSIAAAPLAIVASGSVTGAAVPEPASLGLVGVGAVSLLARRKRGQ